MVLVQKEIKRVTIRPNGTEKQIRPVETEKQYNIDISNFESTTTFNYGDRWTAFSKWWYYFYSWWNTQIKAYKLSTPYDVNNYIELKTETIPSTQEIHQVYISPDGTKLAWANYSSYIWIYDLTTPYDISTKTNLITSNPWYCTWIWFKPDGTELYVARYSSPWLVQYHLSTPWDISTASATASFGGSYRCVSLSPDGQYLLYADSGWTAYQMELTTPRDITTRQNYKSLASHYYPTLAVDGACFLDWRFMWKFYEL